MFSVYSLNQDISSVVSKVGQFGTKAILNHNAEVRLNYTASIATEARIVKIIHINKFQILFLQTYRFKDIDEVI